MHRVEQACAGIPFVLVDIQPDSNVPSINIDQRKGAQLAAEYLIAQGHRNIAQIYGPLSGMDGKLRHDVFIASLKEHNIDVLANEEGNWSSSGGYKAMQTMLSSSRLPTAIFAHNDQMALGAIRAAKDANLQVPKDISFIGFDDIPEAAYFTPPLTTIKQDFTAVGQQSVEYLIALLGDVPPAIHQRIIIPELIERESVLKVV
jgi:DNA-binding LacI/PurR family transcriptional regulator